MAALYGAGVDTYRMRNGSPSVAVTPMAKEGGILMYPTPELPENAKTRAQLLRRLDEDRDAASQRINAMLTMAPDAGRQLLTARLVNADDPRATGFVRATMLAALANHREITATSLPQAGSVWRDRAVADALAQERAKRFAGTAGGVRTYHVDNPTRNKADGSLYEMLAETLTNPARAPNALTTYVRTGSPIVLDDERMKSAYRTVLEANGNHIDGEWDVRVGPNEPRDVKARVLPVQLVTEKGPSWPPLIQVDKPDGKTVFVYGTEKYEDSKPEVAFRKWHDATVKILQKEHPSGYIFSYPENVLQPAQPGSVQMVTEQWAPHEERKSKPRGH
jgi:hypothetical protein